MPIARITSQGLAAIAGLVVLLWTCFIAEQLIIRNARTEYSRALHDIRMLRLKSRPEPVSAPGIRIPRPKRPKVG